MAAWTPCPYRGEHRFDPDRVVALWDRLHAGDGEPLPDNPAVLRAWAYYHEGDLQRAMMAGLAAGGAGITLANQATAVYACHLEPSEAIRQSLLLRAAERAGEQAAREPGNPNAWFWQAYCVARYCQSISVAQSVAQGLGRRVRDALHRTIELQPLHAHAHIALGLFHAEIIDKVGALIGSMTYGAKRDIGLRMIREGLRLNPGSVAMQMEAAKALLLLEGEANSEEAAQLCEQAAGREPLDALERMHVERARAELNV
ncbi:MAG: hypothetical protein V4609_04275 [Pseudomonadota bacterium]